MSKISIFPEGKYSEKHQKIVPAFIPFNNIEFDSYLDQIKDGEYQDEVLAYRNGKFDKLKLRGVTASGVFSYRATKNLTLHSGFICIDIDHKDQIETDFKSLREALTKDNYCYAIHSSVGGFGLAVYIKIVPEKHIEAFLSLEKYFADVYKVFIDKSCKDVSRYRFVSYDPELFINRKSKTWKSYLPKKAIQPKETYIFSGGDLDHIFQQISDRGIDLTDKYGDWFSIGSALAHRYDSAGRDYFHLVSQQSYKYDQKTTDDLYDIILKRKGDKIATIATFIWHCKEAGIEVKTKRTEIIERTAKARRKSIGTNGGAANIQDATAATVKYLNDLENISGADVDEVVAQVMAMPMSEINIKSNDLIADLKAFLKNFDIKFNEITRNYELAGEPMTDRDYNSFYIKAIEQVDEKTTKDKLLSLIDSEFTPSYHPFIDFFEKHKHLKPSGNFEKLCRCITYKQFTYANGTKQEIEGYLEIFLKKWLLGIISSMHGTYSLLILVMTGEQGNRKTKFFRTLLPDDLMEFYAESKLDEGKDSEILMTKKLIIMDDEFGGKSKQDAKRLKELSSKQWFNLRRPYGRTSEDLRRLAVLCGTSNDDEIINDPTGNRRIIPVNLIDVDIDAMDQINKTDLFMELYWEWREIGDGWMLTKDDISILNNSTQLNEQPSAEEEMILKYFVPAESLGGNAIALTNTEIKAYIEEKSPTIRVNPYKLGLCLKSLGFEKKQKKYNGVPRLVYFLEQI